MATLGTPVHAALVFHLPDLGRADLVSLSGWQAGSYRPDRGARPEVDDRVSRYRDAGPVQAMIAEDSRRWLPLDHEIDGVRLVGAEVVSHEPAGPGTSWMRFGHLVLHVETVPGAPAGKAWQALGLLARARSEVYDAFLARVEDVPHPRPGRRAAGLLLSGLPGEHEYAMNRWHGSTALDRRLADLVTLRQRSAEVATPFELVGGSPTPSYRMAVSGHTVALVRLQGFDPHRHGDLLRSAWLDAFMLELVQYEALRQLETRLRRVQDGADDDWRRLADSFRRYRLQQVWSAGSDHPLERALAQRLRGELGTDEVAARLQQELDDHVAAAAASASTRMNAALFALAVGALLIPLFVAMDAEESGWGLGVAWIVSLLLVALLVAVMLEPTKVRELRDRVRRHDRP